MGESHPVPLQWHGYGGLKNTDKIRGVVSAAIG